MFSILNVYDKQWFKKLVSVICLIAVVFSFPTVGLCQETVVNEPTINQKVTVIDNSFPRDNNPQKLLVNSQKDAIRHDHLSLIFFFISITSSMSVLTFLLIKILPSEDSRKRRKLGV